jgi:hypothetical protein
MDIVWIVVVVILLLVLLTLAVVAQRRRRSGRVLSVDQIRPDDRGGRP